MPVNYNLSIIYKIVIKNTKEPIYVGSGTCLSNCKNQHRKGVNNPKQSNYNSHIAKSIRDIGGYDMVEFELIKNYPCKSKAELNNEVSNIIKEFIKNGHSLKNNNLIGRTHKEREAEYRKKNADKIAAKKRIYRQKNADRIKARKAEYYKNNADKIKAYNVEYRKKNADKLKQKYECECGNVISRSSRPKHLKSKKHLNFVNKAL